MKASDRDVFATNLDKSLETLCVPFLDFVMDGRQRRLLRANREVPLPGPALRIFVLLMVRRPKIVSLEDLLVAGWHVPEPSSKSTKKTAPLENSVHQAINKIRGALATSPYLDGVRVNTIVRSDHGKGYSLWLPYPIIDFREEWNRHTRFYGRSEVMRELEDLLSAPQRDRGYVALIGSPGIGKSAILHHWITSQAAVHSWVIRHCVRRGVKDWDQPRTILTNLLAQLGGGEYDLRGDETLETLREAFVERLATRAPTRVVVVLDGVDEIAIPPGTEGPLAAIFPAELPPGVQVLCASRPSVGMSWLRMRPGTRWIELDDPRWHADNACTCRDYWAHLRRGTRSGILMHLTDDFIDRAVTAANGNLLYTIVVAELVASRQMEIDPRQLPDGFAGLLEQSWSILNAAARDGLRVLCAARVPLSLGEIAEVLGDSFDRDEFIDHTRHILLQDRSSGLDCYRVFHEAFREFIARRSPPELTANIHARIASTLAGWPSPESEAFSAAHAIHHRTHAADPAALRDLCLDPRHLRAKLRVDNDRGRALEADLEAAARNVRDAEIGQELRTLYQALRRQSHWVLKSPDALGELLQFALRSSGWSVERSCFALQAGDEPHLVLQHPVQHRDEAVRLLSLSGSTTWDCRISADESTVVCTAFLDVALWDLSSGTVKFFKGHTGMVLGCALSSDHRFVASAGMDCTVRVWNSATGDLVHMWSEAGAIGRLTFAGAHRVVTPCWDGTLDIRDVRTGQSEGRIRAHDGPVLRCVATKDGKRVLTASSDGTLGWWDIASGARIHELLGHHGSVTGCALTENGEHAVSGGRDGTIRVWELATGRCVKLQQSGQVGINHCLFVSDDRQIVSAANDGSIKLWGVDLTRSLPRMEEQGNLPGIPLGAHALATSPKTSLIVTGGYGGVVRVWDAERESRRPRMDRHASSVTHCIFSPDERLVISASDDHTARVWEVDTGSNSLVLHGHTGSVRSCSLDPTGRMLATSAEDGTIRTWDLASGRARAVLEGHKNWVTACVFSECGEYLLSGSSDGTLRRWEHSTGSAAVLRSDPENGITWVAARGDSVLLALESGALELRRRGLVSHLDTPRSHLPVRCALSRDGLSAVSVGDDGCICCWDLATGACRARLAGHNGVVTDCVFWVDDRMILSCSADCTIRLWDTTEKACKRTWYGSSGFLCLAVSREHVAAGDYAGNVWFLRIRDRVPHDKPS